VEETRLSKYLALQGLCSRREADKYIADGLVTVDGVIVREAWFRINDQHTVELKAAARIQQESRLTVVINKPLGLVSSQPEDGYQSAVSLLIEENYFGSDTPPIIKNRDTLAPAGRLDINSTGLLILTQDGRIARQLIGNNTRVEKEYLVRINGDVSNGQLQKLRHGLELDGRILKPAKVNRINEDQFKIILIEGRKRQIRRMCDLVGVRIQALKRVRVGQLKLGKLPSGMWRLLEKSETIV
jgi:23S rRNA pseudouridine2604 synthase